MRPSPKMPAFLPFIDVVSGASLFSHSPERTNWLARWKPRASNSVNPSASFRVLRCFHRWRRDSTDSSPISPLFLVQPAALDDKAGDLVHTFAALQVRKNERPLCAHSRRIGLHYREICTDQRSQVDLVDDEKIGTRNARATLARYFFAGRDVDHVDRQVGELGTESRRKIVATRLDKAQFRQREFPVHLVDGGEVHGSVLANRRMRATAGLDTHDPLGRQGLRPRENELVFLRIDVVGDYVDVVVVPEPLAQRLKKRRFARAHRAADPDAQRSGHERNSLVYCVSCCMEARSSMNAADPRSSIVAVTACALAARTSSSRMAIASCASV